MNDKWYGLLLVEASESHTFFKPEKVAEDIIDCVLRFGYEQSTGLFA